MTEVVSSDHGGAFVDPNTRYVIETSQYPAPLGREYAPISDYKSKYRGLATMFWRFDREKGRIDPKQSFADDQPPAVTVAVEPQYVCPAVHLFQVNRASLRLNALNLAAGVSRDENPVRRRIAGRQQQARLLGGPDVDLDAGGTGDLNSVACLSRSTQVHRRRLDEEVVDDSTLRHIEAHVQFRERYTRVMFSATWGAAVRLTADRQNPRRRPALEVAPRVALRHRIGPDDRHVFAEMASALGR